MATITVSEQKVTAGETVTKHTKTYEAVYGEAPGLKMRMTQDQLDPTSFNVEITQLGPATKTVAVTGNSMGEFLTDFVPILFPNGFPPA